MTGAWSSTALVALALMSMPGAASAQSSARSSEQPSARPALQAMRTATPPAIDGLLDDDAWRAGVQPTGDWLSYNPLHGTSIPQRTLVWIAYDTKYLYFAFQCDDPEPPRIKTSVTRRDNIWSDDWVGLSLDALGTGQTSYHLMVNPSGIQLDMINTISGDEGGIYFIDFDVPRDAPRPVKFFNFQTTAVTQVGTVEKTVAWTNAPGFAISPDGRWLLYSSLESTDADLMLVDNFR